MDRSTPQVDGPPSKKPRTSTPKVKTGCITCKRRRVKCDETKPQCLRCSNFGRVCGGYILKEDKPPPKETSPPVQRKLLSKAMQAPPPSTYSANPSTSQFTFTPPSLPRPPKPSTPLPSGVTFQNERDHQYFCHFRDVTSIELSAGFEPTFWNTTVVQACDNVSIRQLTVAVAALHIAVANNSSNLAAIPNSPDHEYALKLYGEALKGIRHMAPDGQNSLRIALISALLTFCFERFHGDLKRAVMQIQSAIEMVVKWLSSTPMPYRFYRLGSRKGKEVRPIEDDLLMAFVRLDRPSLALATRMEGQTPTPGNRIFSLLFEKDPLDISGSFETISEARIYLEDICWRILPNYNASSMPEGSTFPKLESIQTLIKDWSQSATFPGSSFNLSFQLAQWHDGFLPLLNFSMTSDGEPMFVAAATLHVQALAVDIFLNGASSKPYPDSRSSSISDSRSPPEEHSQFYSGSSSSSLALPSHTQTRKSSMTDMQAHLDVPGPSSVAKAPDSSFPLVKAILDFSRRLIAHPSFVKSFVFEIGIIPSIVDAILLCPDRALKLEAVEILRSMGPRKEGIWDSQTCADAGEKIMAKEDNAVADSIDPLLFDRV